ncbi:hypothetical protein HMPREF0765_2039 [Sphingobacterium spiritivorum ATCC 33300]|uniref:Uncharacterized protein n=1 Tax=Sphingobacterium spiritivorum ATCC 33300 TaxID=525372 RepID=C2FXI3_SPHSI|nr:hypothetical protein HMPREF0765_2039 [Sphingobacterium spiritivorum ATCC 33300]
MLSDYFWYDYFHLSQNSPQPDVRNFGISRPEAGGEARTFLSSNLEM